MIAYAIILVWSVLVFGAVHTYAYTLMNIGILIMTCRYCIQKKNNTYTLIFPKTPVNGLLFIFGLFIFLFLIPVPQFLIHLLSPESAIINEMAQSPFLVIGDKHFLRFGTIALSDFPARNAWVQYTIYVFFFLGLLHVLNKPNHLKQFTILLIIMGAALSLYAIIQKFSNSAYILWVPKSIYRTQRDASGTFINRNHFATLMTMLMLLGVTYSASLSGNKIKKKELSIKKKLSRFISRERQWNQQILISIASFLMGVSIICSASRGGMISFITGAILLIIALASRKQTRRQGVTMIVICLVIGGFSFFSGEDRIVGRFEQIHVSMKDRLRYFERSIVMIKDYPLLGVGASNFQYAYPKYQSPIDQQITIDYAHNDWIQLISELGFIGFFLLMTIIAVYIKNLFRNWRMRRSSVALCLGVSSIAVLLAVSIHSFIDFSLHIPGNMLVFIAIMSIGYQAVHLNYRKNKPQSLLRYTEIPLTRKNYHYWILFIGLIVVLMSLSIKHFVAETYCNTVFNSTLKRNHHPEVSAIKKAIFWDSSNPAYWYKLAWKYIQLRNQFSEQTNEKQWIDYQDQIIHSLEQAVKKNPCDAEYHIRLAWEYHRMQRHKQSPEILIAAADLAMNRAAYVCGDKNFYQLLELAHYWNMRSAKNTDKNFQEKTWQKSLTFYQKVIKLDRKKRCKKQIIQQLKLYQRDEKILP